MVKMLVLIIVILQKRKNRMKEREDVRIMVE